MSEKYDNYALIDSQNYDDDNDDDDVILWFLLPLTTYWPSFTLKQANSVLNSNGKILDTDLDKIKLIVFFSHEWQM